MLAGDHPALHHAAVNYVERRHLHGPSGHSDLSPSLHSISPVPQDHTNSGDSGTGSAPTRDSQHLGVSPFTGPDGRDLYPSSFRLASAASNASHDIPTPPRRHSPDLAVAVAELYSACNRNVSIGDMWINLLSGRTRTNRSVNWKKMFQRIDHRRFTSFGLVHGLLRRVHNYPLLVDRPALSEIEKNLLRATEIEQHHLTRERSRGASQRFHQQPNPIDDRKATLMASSLMDGMHCDDEIVCKVGRPLTEVFDLLPKQHIVCTYAPGVIYC